MERLYVIDTNAIISYFNQVFHQPPLLSAKATHLIEQALSTSSDTVKLSIPSVVFVEIYEKWFRTEEFARKFQYEVFELIKQSPNIEIKPIEREVLENILSIRESLSNHEIHDKIILASAMMLNCSLITTDQSISDYVNKYRVIPAVIR